MYLHSNTILMSLLFCSGSRWRPPPWADSPASSTSRPTTSSRQTFNSSNRWWPTRSSSRSRPTRSSSRSRPTRSSSRSRPTRRPTRSSSRSRPTYPMRWFRRSRPTMPSSTSRPTRSSVNQSLLGGLRGHPLDLDTHTTVIQMRTTIYWVIIK